MGNGNNLLGARNSTERFFERSKACNWLLCLLNIKMPAKYDNVFRSNLDQVYAGSCSVVVISLKFMHTCWSLLKLSVAWFLSFRKLHSWHWISQKHLGCILTSNTFVSGNLHHYGRIGILFSFYGVSIASSSFLLLGKVTSGTFPLEPSVNTMFISFISSYRFASNESFPLSRNDFVLTYFAINAFFNERASFRVEKYRIKDNMRKMPNLFVTYLDKLSNLSW